MDDTKLVIPTENLKNHPILIPLCTTSSETNLISNLHS
jgi:hypothetical protein